ncbi:MAG: DUF3048 domain-containing protein [Coriobacteriia bacterium]|nr:DUF3048 domain-containing protein [Coriobacteriia bacterium]
MKFHHVLQVLGIMVLASALFLLVGCTGDGSPGVVSHWPKAEKERTVAKPAEPLRWPLTGLDALSEEAVSERVVSVKVENSPTARPQTNLQLADVVYESVAEGGVTRFNAIFHSQSPDAIGPVRSARLSDIYIVPQYSALFVFSGASGSVNSSIRATSIENLSEDVGVSRPFFRSSERPRPHNLYVTFAKIREEAAERGMSTTQDVKGLAFDQRAIDASVTVAEISIPFSSANKVVWTYDTATKTYLRVNNGAAHKDKGTGKQLSVRNVVVLWARHNAASKDVAGSTTYDIVLSGSGLTSVFHDGQRYDGTWEAGTDAPPVFKASDGTQIKLAPGNTWFQVVQPTVNIVLK